MAKMVEVKTITRIALLIFIYFVTYGLYNGIINPVPAQGDSWAYHIPISYTIINGTFLNPVDYKLPQWYYPGSSEAINSIFLLLHIPLTLSNLFASIVLFFTLWKLAMMFRLSYYSALLFAVAVCSLNGVVRWFNAVSIDIWVAVFFCWAIILLENPKKTKLFFLKLGFVLGMLIGSKYTAVGFLILILASYWKNIISTINIQRFIIFLIPFSIFGVFWYIRNYISVGSPFYPVSVLGFQGEHLFLSTVGNEILAHPLQMINALFGEFKSWSLVILIPILYPLWYARKKIKFNVHGLHRILLMASVSMIYFLTFPTSSDDWIMVSSLRYSFPFFILLILAVFLIAQKLKRQDWLGYFVIGNMIMVTSFSYYPKLVFFYLPLAVLNYYLINKFEHHLILSKKITN
jgi:hypothetical protein